MAYYMHIHVMVFCHFFTADVFWTLFETHVSIYTGFQTTNFMYFPNISPKTNFRLKNGEALKSNE